MACLVYCTCTTCCCLKTIATHSILKKAEERLNNRNFLVLLKYFGNAFVYIWSVIDLFIPGAMVSHHSHFHLSLLVLLQLESGFIFFSKSRDSVSSSHPLFLVVVLDIFACSHSVLYLLTSLSLASLWSLLPKDHLVVHSYVVYTGLFIAMLFTPGCLQPCYLQIVGFTCSSFNSV